MPVVANISIMLSLQSGQYRSGMTDAQKMNKQFAKSAAEAGYSLREIANGVKLVRPALEAQQKAMESYKRTVRSLDGLQRSGLAKQLGIDPEEIAKLKRVAFEEQQAAFQGKESPAAIAARDEENRNKSITRGLSLLQKEDVALKKLRQDLTDIKVAADANKDLYRSGQYTTTRDQLLANFHGEKIGNQIPAAQRIANEQAAARKQQQIEAENVEAIRATQTAQQQRYAELSQLRSDELGGLSKEAAARRRAAIEARFQENSGGSDLLKLRKNIQDNYNAAVQRGVEIANAARTAQLQYRQTVKNVSKALRESKISQDQFNRAKLQAKRNREDSQLDPILRAGVQSVAPYKQVVRDVTRNIENMRAALKSGLVTKQEFDNSFSGGLGKLRQYSLALGQLRNRLDRGKLSQREFTLAAKQARAAIFGQTSAIQRLMSTVGVFRTVLIGMASAQLYGEVFEGITNAFDFEPAIRTAIAKFRDTSINQRDALRDEVISSTDNRVPLLERVQVLEELAKDGVAADVAIRSLDQTFKFVNASGVQAADAVSLVSEVVNAYGLKSEDAAVQTERMFQTMDLLTASALQTSSDVYEIAQALIRFAPESDQLGISMREAAQGVIAFSELGIKGEVAGNEFSIALRDLKNNAIENEQAFKDLGIQVFSQTGRFRGVSTVAGEMAEAFDGLSAKEKALALESLGVTQKGAKFQQQMITMINVIRDAKTSFEETQGVVDRLSSESLTELEIMTNRVQTGFAYLINNTVVAWLESFASWVNKINFETRRWITTIGLLVAGWTSIVFLGPALISMIRTLITLWRQYAVVQAFIAGFSGPKGWILLASALGAAAVAAGALYASYSSLESLFTADGLSKARDEVLLLNDALNSEREDVGALRELMADTFAEIKQAAAESISLDPLAVEKDEVYQKIKERADELRALAQETDIEGLRKAKDDVQQLITQVSNFSAFDPKQTKQIEQAYKTIASQMDRIKNSLNNVKNPFSPEQLKSFRQELQTIIQQTRNPFERALESANTLKNIKASIGIDPRTEQRQINSILGDLNQQLRTSIKQSIQEFNTSAVSYGTAGDFSVRYRVADTFRDSESRQQHQEQIAELRNGNSSLTTIVERLSELVEEARNQEVVNSYEEY